MFQTLTVTFPSAFQWYLHMLRFAFATWRINWRTRLKAPDWRGHLWAFCWRLWVSKKRTFKRSKAFWRENWKSNWTWVGKGPYACARVSIFLLRCNKCMCLCLNLLKVGVTCSVFTCMSFEKKVCYMKGLIFTSGYLALHPELARALFSNSSDGMWELPHIYDMQCVRVTVQRSCRILPRYKICV